MDIEELCVGNIVTGKRYDADNVATLHVVKIRSVGREDGGEEKHLNEWAFDEDSHMYSLKELTGLDLTGKRLLKIGFKKVAGSSTYKYPHQRLAIVFDCSDNTLTIMKHSRTIYEDYVDFVHTMQNVLGMFQIKVPLIAKNFEYMYPGY